MITVDAGVVGLRGGGQRCWDVGNVSCLEFGDGKIDATRVTLR